MSRPLWTGVLVVGALRIPTQILGAGEAPKIEFHHAHHCTAKRLTRVQQKRWCPTCQRELTHHEIVRVYEHTGGQYLDVTDADLARCAAEPSDALTITSVLDALEPLYIDSTAYLVPNGIAAVEPFATFVLALGAQTAAGRLVRGKRLESVLLAATARGCVLYLLRSATQVAELLARVDVPEPATLTTHTHVHRLRRQLQRLEQPFAYTALHDDYQQRVAQLVQDRIARASTTELATRLRPRRRQKSQG